MPTRSEVPADLEHEVYRGLRIEAGLGVVEVVLLEVGAPEPCVGVVLVIQDDVTDDVEIMLTEEDDVDDATICGGCSKRMDEIIASKIQCAMEK